ncbi:hypothetical protein TWF594_005454 [Orbilia oligospora]|nr:hypothetical protein TWF594_005454 [Orbilia oligospora]
MLKPRERLVHETMPAKRSHSQADSSPADNDTILPNSPAGRSQLECGAFGINIAPCIDVFRSYRPKAISIASQLN